MVLIATAIEDLRRGAFISILFNDSNQIHARQSVKEELPDAIAARDIGKGESITLDTGRATGDLLRPGSWAYRSRESVQ